MAMMDDEQIVELAHSIHAFLHEHVNECVADRFNQELGLYLEDGDEGFLSNEEFKAKMIHWLTRCL